MIKNDPEKKAWLLQEDSTSKSEVAREKRCTKNNLEIPRSKPDRLDKPLFGASQTLRVRLQQTGGNLNVQMASKKPLPMHWEMKRIPRPF
jgi:hypothetical protein